ncbi:MAG TPA: glycosyltransferase family A protein, partial [Polyangiaceae bacterium]
MPKVTAVIPTYNRREYVQEAIDSIIAQTFRDYEIIVVDDGSTDGTREALPARYGERIRYLWQTNQGESAARNHALSLAMGQYIAFLDSDDLWLPDKLTKQVALLEQRQDIGAAFCQAWIINEHGQ